MTMIQQLFIVIVALSLLPLALRLLIKSRFLPALLWWGAGQLYPTWRTAHNISFYCVLALLILVSVASWLGPVVDRKRQERMAVKILRKDIVRAHEEGREIDCIEIVNGFPLTKYRE